MCGLAAIAAGMLAWSAAAAEPAPANTLAELWRELGACLDGQAPGPGSELTIVFALKRDGSLLGAPRISHSHLSGDAAAQRAFVAHVLGAFAKCLPLRISDKLGGAIAGRLMSFRIGGRAKETDV